MATAYGLCSDHFAEEPRNPKTKNDHYRYGYSAIPRHLMTCERIIGFRQDKETNFQPRNVYCGQDACWVVWITLGDV